MKHFISGPLFLCAALRLRQMIDTHIVANVERLRGCWTVLARAAFAVALGAAVAQMTCAPAAAFCAGDCNGSGSVSTAEAATCQDQYLNGIPIAGNPCPACDCDENGTIDASEIALVQSNVGHDCNPAECPPPTPTPQSVGTPVPTANPPTATATAPPTIEPTLPLATSTPGGAPTPTPFGTSCVGDCDGNHIVLVNELLECVNVALGLTSLDTCSVCSTDGATVTISNLITAINDALNGCPA